MRHASLQAPRSIRRTGSRRSRRAACFTAGTKIHTKDGFKAIESIKAGDYVWSENPETHEKALKKVKKIFVREKDSVVRLSINGEAIETTNEHPFYVEGHGWTNVSDLKAGDKVRLEDGTTGIVEKTKHAALDTPVTVYNFEVENFHTYYVSEQKVLVHNTCAATAKNTQVAKASNGKVKPEYNKASANKSSKDKRKQSSNNPLENIKYTDKVKMQMEQGDYHAFPESVDAFGMDGKISTIKGNDGIIRTKVEIEGGYKKEEGVFEYIIEPDGVTVNHRMFRPRQKE